VILGLKCVAVSVITNMAAGMGAEVINHEHTKKMTPLGRKN
jgi:purine-nucleoside phosphorylase